MVKKKLYIKTYGCQMNVYDSIRMKELLDPHGYTVTETLEESDLVILNTCHIREKASEKIYSELGRLKQLKDKKQKNGSDLILAVAGCVGQAEGDEIFARTPYVSVVVGPQSYHTLPELLARINRQEKHLIALDFIEEAKFDKLPEAVASQGSSAVLSVQEGCDKFCAFCVVPYTRGAEFSRPLEQVYREALQLVSSGAKEITLLGQNVNAYHGKSDSGTILSLADLIIQLEKIKRLERIRYMTSHPNDMRDDLIALHGSSDKLMPFLHLPIQSGSDQILKSMNRKHTRDDYLKIIDKLLKARPDIALSSDFIVGFPGETDQDFNDTVSIVKEVQYSQCFSFKYSPRPGTPAAIKSQVLEQTKSERLKILQEEISAQQLAFNKKTIGKILPVLFERDGKHEDQIIGKSPYLQSVHIKDHKTEYRNKIVNVEITNASQMSLAGEVV